MKTLSEIRNYVKNAKTSELLAEFNARRTATIQIKKFTDRATAEKRMTDILIAEMDVIDLSAPLIDESRLAAPVEAEVKADKPKRDRKPAAAAKSDKPKRADLVLAILQKKGGASIESLAAHFDTVYKNITGDLYNLRKQGHDVVKTRVDGENVFTVAAPTPKRNRK